MAAKIAEKNELLYPKPEGKGKIGRNIFYF